MHSPVVPRPQDPAQRAAAVIADGFDDYNARFSDITRRARRRFERRDWKLAQSDNTGRIDLYDVCLRETLSRLEGLLEDRVRSRPLWRGIRTAYAERIAALPDRELYKTFPVVIALTSEATGLRSHPRRRAEVRRSGLR